MKRHILLVGVAAALGLAAPAADPPIRHFTCPVDELQFLKGELPPPQYEGLAARKDAVDVLPGSAVKSASLHVRLDGPGEVELVVETGSGVAKWSHVFLVVRTAE